MNRECVCDAQRATDGQSDPGLSQAPNFRPLRISRNTIQHSAFSIQHSACQHPRI